MIVRFRRNAMGHLAFKTQLVLAFGVAIVILVCIGVFSYSRALQEDADQNWVAHTHQVLEELDALLASLATQRMGLLIDDLLNLSRVTRAEMRREPVDMRHLANVIAVE